MQRSSGSFPKPSKIFNLWSLYFMKEHFNYISSRITRFTPFQTTIFLERTPSPSINIIIYTAKFSQLLITRLLRGVGRWARKHVNHTSLMTAVTPTDSPKSVRNRCLIELFCGVVCVFTVLFDISVVVGAFVIGLSQIFLFLAKYSHVKFVFMWRKHQAKSYKWELLPG